jgi:serine/threonine-protein kinase
MPERKQQPSWDSNLVVTLEAGTCLGRYTILAPIGAGGMGEVYRARDCELEREVAIKVLPAEVAANSDHLERLRREARALAKLSHAGILQIFDIGDAEGIAYVVTELLDGQTLRALLERGALPWRRVVDLGAALAEALAAAHAQAVVHRDVKPENLFITGDGQVKILDFGLARVAADRAGDGESKSPTVPQTSPGTVLGTIGYMSPEQVRGEPADHRSDIFSLGCVLYELLSGRRAFHAATAPETLTAILRESPAELTATGIEVIPGLERVVRRCMDKTPERRFQSAGDLAFALRGLADPSAAFASDVAPRSGAPADRRPSIAVLPFDNLSADPEQEYFCDGMAEEIINSLAHLNGLRVIARTSSFAFKGRQEDIRVIGSALDVEHVLEGSVRKAGNRLRITAQLITVSDGSHLWSERFDRTLEDVFAIQDEIALAIVDNLKVRLLGDDRAAIVKRYTDSLEAHNAYLEGLSHWNKLSPDGYQRSHACWQEALRIDPDFAPAHVGLAVWYFSQSFWGNMSPEVSLPQGLPLVERALAIESALAEAHGAMGCIVSLFKRDPVAGERWLRQGVELGPNVAVHHLNYGLFMLTRGRFDEAVAACRMAQRLDPVSVTVNSWAARCAGIAGRHTEAVADLQKLMGSHPQHWLPPHDLSDILARCGQLDEARAEGERAVGLSDGATIAVTHLACVSHITGDHERGNELFEQLAAQARTSYVAPSFLAWVHMARGEGAEAVRHLEHAARVNDPWLGFTRHYLLPQLLDDGPVNAHLESLGW